MDRTNSIASIELPLRTRYPWVLKYLVWFS
jgi:hypothetical protein